MRLTILGLGDREVLYAGASAVADVELTCNKRCDLLRSPRGTSTAAEAVRERGTIENLYRYGIHCALLTSLDRAAATGSVTDPAAGAEVFIDEISVSADPCGTGYRLDGPLGARASGGAARGSVAAVEVDVERGHVLPFARW